MVTDDSFLTNEPAFEGGEGFVADGGGFSDASALNAGGYAPGPRGYDDVAPLNANSLYLSGARADGSLTYNYGDTYQAPDGSTVVPEVVVTAPSTPSGPVVFLGGEAAAASGFGLAGGAGVCAALGGIPQVGVYTTGGMAVGEGASAQLAGGAVSSLAAFTGNSASMTAGEGIGTGASVNNAGFGGSLAIGPAVGVTAASTYTTVHPIDASGFHGPASIAASL